MILIAIGANLPSLSGRPAIETCRWAIGRLGGLPGLRVRGLSRWYRTAPVPAADQPDYINGVVHLEGAIAPEAMLAALHTIEVEAGRARGLANAARTLDLDLIGMDALVRSGPDLILPHPRLQDRTFVLWPLRDVAPGWRHPLLQLNADDMLARLGAASAGEPA